MKKFLIAFFALGSFSAFADESVVCALLKSDDSKTFVSARVDLDRPSDDAVQSNKGLDIGKDNYSFDLSAKISGDRLAISVFIYENNNVQDEIGEKNWKVSLKKVAANPKKPVVTETIEDNSGKKTMKMVCYYNKK